MAVYANITADQGTSFSASVVVTDANGGEAADLTGFTAQAQARRTYTSTGSFPFSAVVSTPASGLITLTMSSSVTETMSGRYLYDVEVTDSNGAITRVIEGQLYVNPGITR